VFGSDATVYADCVELLMLLLMTIIVVLFYLSPNNVGCSMYSNSSIVPSDDGEGNGSEEPLRK